MKQNKNLIVRQTRINFATLLLVAAVVIGAAWPTAQAADSEHIVAVVNDDAITDTDLDERLQLIIVSSGMPNNEEIRTRLKPQILSSLIEEQLKLQEAKRLEIEVSAADIDAGFLSIAQSNNLTTDQFLEVLKRSKVSPLSIRNQIRANIAWQKVVGKEVHPTVSINDNEVDSVLERLRGGVGKTEYLVSEIFLPVETPKDEPSVRQLADKVTRELAQGKVPFPQVAAQVSQSASASKGGSLGWIQEGLLAEDIDEALAKMKEGEISKPIRTPAGFYVMALRKKRAIAEENIPAADQVRSQLGMQELERRAQRYLWDLKGAAFIERRI